MFKGYLEWSGIELLNRQRTEAYVANLGPHLLKTVGGANTLHIVTGEEAYTTPLLDAAPWSNRFDGATDQFLGLYPLDITGIGDSTYSATTTEGVDDGGTTQQGRSSTRDVKVSALIVGSSELGAESGMTWLRAALQAADCSDRCGGYLRYFLTEPAVCEVAWGDENGRSDRAQFGSVSAGERIVYRWSQVEVDPTMPSRAEWTTSAVESVQVRYGAMDADGQVLWSTTVEPYRVNYVPNPTFRSTATGFTGAPITWGNGGVDGGGCATIGSSGVTTSARSDTWATPPGAVTVSFWIRSDAGTTVTGRLVDQSTGDVVDGGQWTATDEWTRYSLSGDTTTTVLQFDQSDLFMLDEVLAEYSTELLDYFDGDLDFPNRNAAWLGTRDASPSTLTLTEPMEIVADDSDYRPFFQVVAGTAPSVRLLWNYREAIDVATQLLPIDRTLHNVSVTQAPQIVQTVDATQNGGGYYIQVEFLFNAGIPFAYSPGLPVDTSPLTSLTYTDPTPQNTLDDDWLFDPTALVPSAAPSAPDILADAIDASITTWQRYYAIIPPDKVADWANSVPILTLNSHDQPIRQVRVRFHPNPFGYDAARVDPMAFCADFLVSYLPPYTSLMLNGITQTATASRSGVATVPADSILYGSTGGPMTWPRLSCGIGYVMTVDVPNTGDYDLFDVELQMLREE